MPNSESMQPSTEGAVVVFNPSEIFGMYSDFLARQGGRVVSVRGIYSSGAGKSYVGFYYDVISDQYSGQELGIKIPELLRDRLSDGNLVDLAGVIERKLNQKGSIQLILAVTRADIVLEQTAQAILDARAKYPDCSLADLYDELTMPVELRKAHQENDKAVMEAYGFNWRTMTESDCVAELFKLYKLLSGERQS